MGQSQCIGVPYMMSDEFVKLLHVPPVSNATNLPIPSTMMLPESPLLEKGPYPLSWGMITASIELASLLGGSGECEN